MGRDKDEDDEQWWRRCIARSAAMLPLKHFLIYLALEISSFVIAHIVASSKSLVIMRAK